MKKDKCKHCNKPMDHPKTNTIISQYCNIKCKRADDYQAKKTITCTYCHENKIAPGTKRCMSCFTGNKYKGSLARSYSLKHGDKNE